MFKKLIDPKNTAVLVVDLQNDYCSEKGVFARGTGFDMRPVQITIPKISKFLKIARLYKSLVIWTQAIADPLYLKPNAALKIRSHPTPFILSSPDTWGFDYYKIKPASGDLEIVKKGYDSFSSLKLNKILKSKKIKNLIVLGVYTSICVDTTVRTAFKLGYNVIVPSDLVSMPKEWCHLHTAALTNMNVIFAYVSDSRKITDLWKKEFSKDK